MRESSESSDSEFSTESTQKQNKKYQGYAISGNLSGRRRFTALCYPFITRIDWCIDTLMAGWITTLLGCRNSTSDLSWLSIVRPSHFTVYRRINLIKQRRVSQRHHKDNATCMPLTWYLTIDHPPSLPLVFLTLVKAKQSSITIKYSVATSTYIGTLSAHKR